jgi:hypothetical protein
MLLEVVKHGNVSSCALSLSSFEGGYNFNKKTFCLRLQGRRFSQYFLPKMWHPPARCHCATTKENYKRSGAIFLAYVVKILKN